MRAIASVVVIRIQRAFTSTVWLVVDAVLLVTVAAVDQTPPPCDVSMVKFFVLRVAASPPAPACLTVNFLMDWPAPRSTSNDLLPAAAEHHLSLRPAVTVPLTALAGVSVALHVACLVFV